MNKFLLENDSTGLQWKWASVKPGGCRPAPRSGVNLAVAPNGKGYIFGGVLDVNEDEESLEGTFSNEMHMLELSTATWRLIELKGKKDNKPLKSKDIDVEMDASSTSTSHGEYLIKLSNSIQFNLN